MDKEKSKNFIRQLNIGATMDAKAKTFLEWNKDNIFKNLIQAEDHLRNVGENPNPEWLNCIVKHLAYAEAEAEEAISHSLSLQKSSDSKNFAKLRDKIRELRKAIQRGELKSPEEGILKVREIRRFFEDFNPEYDVSKCQSCGEKAKEALKKIQQIIKQSKISMKDIERKYAQDQILYLSLKHGVPPPKLTIREDCSDPNYGMHKCDLKAKKGEIIICKGGANAHVIAHEFRHYLQCLGKAIPEGDAEADAEKFAEQELSQHKIVKYQNYNKIEASDVGMKEVLLVYGFQHLAKGLERGFKEIDRVTGREALAIWERPSFWLNTAIAVGVPIAVAAKAIPEDWAIPMLILGGHMSTTWWDYGEEQFFGGGQGLRLKTKSAPKAAARFV